MLGGVLEVLGVLEEYIGGFRSVRRSILEILGVFWRF